MDNIYGDGIGKVEYVEHMGNDLTIVNAARVSLGKHKEDLDDDDIKLIKYLLKNKHTSTFEHCLITFRFKVPLFVRSQHHRHRTWSYNEISRRYTSENIEFYVPQEFKAQHKINRQASDVAPVENQGINKYLFEAAYRNSFVAFKQLLSNGVSREQARMILPQNLYTEYYGTVNLNNLFKFLKLRDHEHAQYEIQLVAKACLSIAEELYPIATKAWQEISQR